MNSDKTFEIRKLYSADKQLEQTLGLVWRVFQEYEAPEYPAQGIAEFRSYIAPQAIRREMDRGNLDLWACLRGDQVVGMIASRSLSHITLLFVDGGYHRRGIASRLYESALNHCRENGGGQAMTVHSSPYAVQAYCRLGFEATGQEQTVNGLRFTPMRHVAAAAQGTFKTQSGENPLA